MATDIPDITRNFVNIKDGRLQFETMKECAYWQGKSVFTAGNRTNVYIMTKEGEPVFLRMEDSELIIEKLTEALQDKVTGHYVGGRIVEIARFDICE